MGRPLGANASKTPAVVYFIRIQGDGPIKIGSTTRLADRIKQVQIASPYEVRLLGTLPDPCRLIEGQLHERFAPARIRGEWFAPTPELLALIETCDAADFETVPDALLTPLVLDRTPTPLTQRGPRRNDPRCLVCKHAERGSIEEAIKSGVVFSEIARIHAGTTRKSAANHFKRHMGFLPDPETGELW